MRTSARTCICGLLSSDYASQGLISIDPLGYYGPCASRRRAWLILRFSALSTLWVWRENGKNVVGVWFLLSSKSPAKAKYCAISRVSKSRITCGGWQPPSKPGDGLQACDGEKRRKDSRTGYNDTPAAKTLPLIRLGGRCALTFFSKKSHC